VAGETAKRLTIADDWLIADPVDGRTIAVPLAPILFT